MLVILDAAVFAGVPDPMELPALFWLVNKRQHILLTEPLYDPGQPGSEPIDSWLRLQEAALRKEVGGQLMRCMVEAAAQRASLRRVRIVVGSESNWQAAPPRLSLTDALDFLQQPLTAHLENKDSDARLLRALADAQQRQVLANAEAQGLLRFQGAGGIDELLKRLKEGDGQPKRHLRWWSTWDRDSGAQGGLSATATKLRDLCRSQSPPLEYGPLSRRMSESYLPLPLLALWTQMGTGSERKMRTAIYAELARMPASLRYCFEMKRGLLWGLPEARREELTRPGSKRGKHAVARGPTVSREELFAAFPDVPISGNSTDEQMYLNELARAPQRLHTLQQGLGKQIGELFDVAPPHDLLSWIQAEVPVAERFDLIQTLLDRI